MVIVPTGNVARRCRLWECFGRGMESRVEAGSSSLGGSGPGWCVELPVRLGQFDVAGGVCLDPSVFLVGQFASYFGRDPGNE